MGSKKGQGMDKGKGKAPKQPPKCPPESSSEDEEGAERRAIWARIATLEQGRGLPPRPTPVTGSESGSRRTRLAAYKKNHSDVLQRLALLEGTIPHLAAPADRGEGPSQPPVMPALPLEQPPVPPAEQPGPSQLPVAPEDTLLPQLPASPGKPEGMPRPS